MVTINQFTSYVNNTLRPTGISITCGRRSETHEDLLIVGSYYRDNAPTWGILMNEFDGYTVEEISGISLILYYASMSPKDYGTENIINSFQKVFKYNSEKLLENLIKKEVIEIGEDGDIEPIHEGILMIQLPETTKQKVQRLIKQYGKALTPKIIPFPVENVLTPSKPNFPEITIPYKYLSYLGKILDFIVSKTNFETFTPLVQKSIAKELEIPQNYVAETLNLLVELKILISRYSSNGVSKEYKLNSKVVLTNKKAFNT